MTTKPPSTAKTTRRDFLAATAAGLAAPLVLPGAARSGGDTVTFGLTLALSGPYAEEGREELAAAALAVDHLNGDGDGGMLATFSPCALEGAGLLGRRVACVPSDTGTDAAAALRAARELIARDRAVMVSGGSSSAIAVALQGLAEETGTVFMAGLSHANETTGRDRNAHGFRHFLNAHISALALAPALAEMFGSGRRAAHVSVDTPWGRAQQASMNAATEARGWRTVRSVTASPTSTDLTPEIARATSGDAEVLILNLYGGPLLSGLRAAAALRLRDRGIEVAVPVQSDLVARRAGEAIAGVVGTQNWHPDLQSRLGDRYAGTDAFVRAYAARTGRLPGQAAQTCYAQILLYADAVARAGTTHPCAVIEALEDHAFDGLGTGPSLYRGADHQCLKDVAVVRGAGSAANPLELLRTVPAATAEYPPDHPAFAGGRILRCAAPA